MSHLGITNKSDSMEGKKMSNSNLYWIIGILAISLIITSYFAFFSDKNFMESEMIKFITYTSSLLSIVLSCFAIVYAYLTSFDTSNKLSSMDSTLKSIDTMSNNLNRSHESLRQLVEGMSAYLYQNNPDAITKNDTKIDKNDIKGNQVQVDGK